MHFIEALVIVLKVDTNTSEVNITYTITAVQNQVWNTTEQFTKESFLYKEDF